MPQSKGKCFVDIQKSRKALAQKAKRNKERRQKKAKEIGAAMVMPGLTERQRQLVIGVSSGMTQREAGLIAGYSPNGIDSRVSQEIKKGKVQECLHELMERAGLGIENLLRMHYELCQATKPISVLSGKDADSKSADFIEVPDWSARGNGLNMAYKLKGLYQDQNVNMTVETHEQRMARLRGQGSGEG